MSAQHDMDIITLYVCIYITFSDIATWAYDHIQFYSCNQIGSCHLKMNVSKIILQMVIWLIMKGILLCSSNVGPSRSLSNKTWIAFRM